MKHEVISLPPKRFRQCGNRNWGRPVDGVKAVGVASENGHVSKIVYSAHTRWTELGDLLLLAAAARQAGLLE